MLERARLQNCHDPEGFVQAMDELVQDSTSVGLAQSCYKCGRLETLTVDLRGRDSVHAHFLHDHLLGWTEPAADTRRGAVAAGALPHVLLSGQD